MTSLEFQMPDVGEGIAEAEIITWFVEVGDQIQEDQPLCEVETDKAVVEIPAPATGTVNERRADAGEVVAVGSVLVVIELKTPPDHEIAPVASTLTTAAVALPADPPVGDTSTTSATVTASLETPPVSTAGTRRPKASPRIRRMAVQRRIDLTTIVGTGPHGRILESDLGGANTPATSTEGATSSPVRTPVSTGVRRSDEVVPLRGLRRTIARSMTEALAIPHVTEFREVDATNLLAAHRALRASLAERGVRMSLFPLLLKAAIRALELQPSMNATFDSEAETITRHGSVHLGMATATDDGLIVPVIQDADQLGLIDLVRQVERLAKAARNRTAQPDDLTGGTFTVTNFGSFGTWLGNPIIRHPEVGIAGFGRIDEKVIAVDGQPVVRPILPIVVATDHRVHDGSHLADFVTVVAEAVTEPVLLLA